MPLKFTLRPLSKSFSSLGNCWNWRSEGGLWHHPDGRQLHQHRQGCHVGKKRVRQHLKVPAVSADGQCGCCNCGVHRRLHHTGWFLSCLQWRWRFEFPMYFQWKMKWSLKTCGRLGWYCWENPPSTLQHCSNTESSNPYKSSLFVKSFIS